jgi:hypothetical protein
MSGLSLVPIYSRPGPTFRVREYLSRVDASGLVKEQTPHPGGTSWIRGASTRTAFGIRSLRPIGPFTGAPVHRQCRPTQANAACAPNGSRAIVGVDRHVGSRAGCTRPGHLPGGQRRLASHTASRSRVTGREEPVHCCSPVKPAARGRPPGRPVRRPTARSARTPQDAGNDQSPERRGRDAHGRPPACGACDRTSRAVRSANTQPSQDHERGGGGPVIQILPGPYPFADSAAAIINARPPDQQADLMKKSHLGPYSNNVAKITGRHLAHGNRSRCHRGLRVGNGLIPGCRWRPLESGHGPRADEGHSFQPALRRRDHGLFYHGASGVHTPLVPTIRSSLALWAYAHLYKNDQLVTDGRHGPHHAAVAHATHQRLGPGLLGLFRPADRGASTPGGRRHPTRRRSMLPADSCS